MTNQINLSQIVALHINEARRKNMTGEAYIAWLDFKDRAEEQAERDFQ